MLAKNNKKSSILLIANYFFSEGGSMIVPYICLLLGIQILNFVDSVPEIILSTFKEYPYLHSPSLQEKREYLGWFADNKEGMLVVALDQNTLAGFITGVPMRAAEEYIPEIDILFRENNFHVDDCYYCGDVIVLSGYQRQGLCSKMFSAFEQKVKKWGYKRISLITAVREENHPLKPAHYVDPGNIWQHYGFEKTGIIIKNMQPTVVDTLGTVAEQENSFVFWVKDLK